MRLSKHHGKLTIGFLSLVMVICLDVNASKLNFKIYPVVRLLPQKATVPIKNVARIEFSDDIDDAQRKKIEVLEVSFPVNADQEYQYLKDEIAIASIRLAIQKVGAYELNIQSPPLLQIRRAKGIDQSSRVIAVAESYLNGILEKKLSNISIRQLGVIKAELNDDDFLRARLSSEGELSRRMCVLVDSFQKGELVNTFPVWFAIDGSINALALKDAVEKNQMVSAGQIEFIPVNLSELSKGVVLSLDKLQGVAYSQSLPKGALLRKNMLHSSSLVYVGEQVKVISKSGRVSIEIIAIANQSGNFNQKIEFRNIKSGELFFATIVGEGKAVADSNIDRMD